MVLSHAADSRSSRHFVLSHDSLDGSVWICQVGSQIKHTQLLPGFVDKMQRSFRSARTHLRMEKRIDRIFDTCERNGSTAAFRRAHCKRRAQQQYAGQKDLFSHNYFMGYVGF